MSLIKRETLIGTDCAAALLDLSESAVRLKKCGTENLTHIRRGTGKRQRISLILEEVIELKAGLIEAAIKERLKKLSSGKSSGGLKLVG
jgi:hypothetical protein